MAVADIDGSDMAGSDTADSQLDSPTITVSEEYSDKPKENVSADGSQIPKQEPAPSYAERCKYFLKELDERCKTEGVRAGVVILLDPKSAKPLLYTIGEKYEQAVLACDAARLIKEKLFSSEELTV